MSSYPIVDQRSLVPSRRRGLLGIRGPRRDETEIPRAAAHQLLVYRVRGDYLEDRAGLRTDDSEVIEATHVSVVDLTADREVQVAFAIPSSDAGQFQVAATFACTVTDAAAVVREGIVDAESQLRSYLRTHGRIKELGLRHPLTDLNETRKDVRAEIEAYTVIVPPVVPGMRTRFVSADVLTPDEIAKLEERRRGINRHQTIESEQEIAEYQLRRLRARNSATLDDDARQREQRLAVDDQMHEQDMREQTEVDHLRRADRHQDHELRRDDRRLEHERRQAAAQESFELDRQALRRAHARNEFLRTRELMGDQPEEHWSLAAAAGEISPTEHAALLAAERERRREAERAQRAEEREDQLRELEWWREERGHERELERERARWERADTHERQRWDRDEKAEDRTDSRRELDRKHERGLLEISVAREKEVRDHETRMRDSEGAREERLQQQVWARDDRLRHEKSQYETQRRRMEINLEALRELAQRGHIDAINLDLEKFVNGMVEGAPPPGEAPARADVIDGAKADELPPGQKSAGPGSTGPRRSEIARGEQESPDDRVDIREEDDSY